MIPLEDVRIQLSHHRTGSAQASSGETVLERIDSIDGTIELIGNLDANQRSRLLEIAGRCWMHRTLSAGVSIRFHLDEKSHAGAPRRDAVQIASPEGVSN